MYNSTEPKATTKNKISLINNQIYVLQLKIHRPKMEMSSIKPLHLCTSMHNSKWLKTETTKKELNQTIIYANDVQPQFGDPPFIGWSTM